jgi:thimet oligopeptidase
MFSVSNKSNGYEKPNDLMKPRLSILLMLSLMACNRGSDMNREKEGNPFFPGMNHPVAYAEVTPDHIEAYARITLHETEAALKKIRSEQSPDLENVFKALDDVFNELTKASNNCYMLYWVSPDSLSRVKGLEGYRLLDSLATGITADGAIYRQMVAFAGTPAYGQLQGHRKIFVDDMMRDFEHAGARLDPEPHRHFKELKAEITRLSSDYSTNMNTANEILVLDAAGAEGLPDNFRETYKTGDHRYEIPVMPATLGPVMGYASKEATRKMYLMKYRNRAADKNLVILDSLVKKRYELARLMGYDSYAGYTTSVKMAKTPGAVWDFINDLMDRSGEKAMKDHETLKKQRNLETGTRSSAPIHPWDVDYYRNQVLKTKYQVDYEAIREYLPLEQCLSGMFEIYGELFGLEYREIKDASVWHKEVRMYEVWEGDSIQGRFYLDLFPRPSKESWFYGVGLTPGRATGEGYEVPVCMLLGNFTPPTESLPSLISFDELSTLFHEFGHIMDAMSYHGEFASQSNSKADFGEAMSQLFENWPWDYNTLAGFARHYQTHEVLPRQVFDNMLKARNVTSGVDVQRSLANCIYDMELYDRYDPQNPEPTDEIWKDIDRRLALPQYIEGAHPQASWIHINTHPTYYYGYLWAEVYAQDLFTVFEEKGLRDPETGKRYRRLILSNGTQRDIDQAVTEFLGRPSNNEAYIRSLGL